MFSISLQDCTSQQSISTENFNNDLDIIQAAMMITSIESDTPIITFFQIFKLTKVSVASLQSIRFFPVNLYLKFEDRKKSLDVFFFISRTFRNFDVICRILHIDRLLNERRSEITQPCFIIVIYDFSSIVRLNNKTLKKNFFKIFGKISWKDI